MTQKPAHNLTGRPWWLRNVTEIAVGRCRRWWLSRCGWCGQTGEVEFVIARNPEAGSSLPYLVRLPLGSAGVVLKVRDTWPRAAKVYCHRADEWPAEVEIVERVPVKSCLRRGAAIDLVLDRGRENRS